MDKIFSDEMPIRHVIKNEIKNEIKFGQYNKITNKIICEYNNTNEEYTSLSKFSTIHYKQIGSSRTSSNGWIECEIYKDNNWVCADTLRDKKEIEEEIEEESEEESILKKELYKELYEELKKELHKELYNELYKELKNKKSLKNITLNHKRKYGGIRSAINKLLELKKITNKQASHYNKFTDKKVYNTEEPDTKEQNIFPQHNKILRKHELMLCCGKIMEIDKENNLYSCEKCYEMICIYCRSKQSKGEIYFAEGECYCIECMH